MATAFSAQDVARLRSQFLSPGHEDLVGLYTFMGTNGYAYATLALGVVTGATPDGRIANAFMAQSAEHQGVRLTPEVIQSIKLDMANAWLDALATRANRGPVDDDLNFNVTQQFHKEVFKAHSLSEDTWTLTALGKVFGTQNAETMWRASPSAMSW